MKSSILAVVFTVTQCAVVVVASQSSHLRATTTTRHYNAPSANPQIIHHDTVAPPPSTSIDDDDDDDDDDLVNIGPWQKPNKDRPVEGVGGGWEHDDDGYHDRNIIVNPDFRPTKDFRPNKPYPPLVNVSNADEKRKGNPIHDDSFRYYDPEADPDAVVPPMPGNHDDDDGPDNEERANQKNYDYGNWEPPAHDITLG